MAGFSSKVWVSVFVFLSGLEDSKLTVSRRCIWNDSMSRGKIIMYNTNRVGSFPENWKFKNACKASPRTRQSCRRVARGSSSWGTWQANASAASSWWCSNSSECLRMGTSIQKRGSEGFKFKIEHRVYRYGHRTWSKWHPCLIREQTPNFSDTKQSVRPWRISLLAALQVNQLVGDIQYLPNQRFGGSIIIAPVDSKR